jgi:hypothetical protein
MNSFVGRVEMMQVSWRSMCTHKSTFLLPEYLDFALLRACLAMQQRTPHLTIFAIALRESNALQAS